MAWRGWLGGRADASEGPLGQSDTKWVIRNQAVVQFIRKMFNRPSRIEAIIGDVGGVHEH